MRIRNLMDPVLPVLPNLKSVRQTEDPPEACGLCRFWDRANAQEMPGVGQVARCRRFPPESALATTIVQGMDKRGNLVSQPQQQPCILPKAIPAGEWCGEFQADLRLHALDMRGKTYPDS